MRRRITALACFSALTGAAYAAPSSSDLVRLTPHRAIYDLALAKSGGASRSVEAARGRIVFDFTGDACEGYALKYRQVTVLESGETGSRTSDLRTTTFEDGDGSALRFKNDSLLDGRGTKTIDGEAELRRDTLSVRLRQPKREEFSASGEVVFPSEHMKRLILAARAGESTLTIKIFDGSDDGKKVYDTLAVIGRKIEPGRAEALEDAAKQEGLAKLARWPVTLSYFLPGEGERTPLYTMSFELYDNGVSRALQLDYGNFALRGDMQRLELLPDTACQR
jgi:hypothetical protein